MRVNTDRMPSSATRDVRIWRSGQYWAQDLDGVHGSESVEEDWGVKESMWILGKFFS